jgi:hypothetical protein
MGLKLICEQYEDLEYLTESSKKNGNYYIKGTFIQTETPNRNKRVYNLDEVKKEVSRYQKDFIARKRAYGELGHPDSPTINMERVSHLVTELKQNGKNFVGKAKILKETPYGKIAKALIDEGCQLAVSTRGMGSLTRKGELFEVRNYKLAVAGDIVADPSAPEAFVDGIFEGKEWFVEDGLIQESDFLELKKVVHRTTLKNREETFTQVFESFLSKIAKR